jgi:hypothetical protein
MKNTIITISLLASLPVFSIEHSLAAHEHGTIKLGMAVEKNIVDLDLDGPTEAFIGFEYLPKTDKEKKLFGDVKKLWEKKILDLVIFEKKLICKISESSFKQVIDEKETAEEQAKINGAKNKEAGVHSDIEAKAKITCSGNVVGTEVQIAFRKYFKNIKKLTAEVLSIETKSVEITKPIQAFKI